jgi:HlyD family secretion protein
MSFSMFVGRVLLPCLGVALGGLLFWQLAHNGTVGYLKVPALTQTTWSQTESSSPPIGPAKVARRSSEPPVLLAEGRVVACPGAEVVVGAESTGTVTRVLVQEKSVVHRGDLLAEFRSEELKASLDEAVAHVAETDAELAQLEQDHAKVISRPENESGNKEAHERVKIRLVGARAKRAAAAAVYKRIEAEFARTRIRAPLDGVVVSRSVNPGETVSLGMPLFKIADLARLRIEAEVNEFDIPRCVLGSRATIKAEGYRGKSWPGRVDEIADAVAPRRNRADDPGRPTSGLVLPIRLNMQESMPLKLGQRVEVEIAELEDKVNPPDPVAELSDARAARKKR